MLGVIDIRTRECNQIIHSLCWGIRVCYPLRVTPIVMVTTGSHNICWRLNLVVPKWPSLVRFVAMSLPSPLIFSYLFLFLLFFRISLPSPYILCCISASCLHLFLSYIILPSPLFNLSPPLLLSFAYFLLLFFPIRYCMGKIYFLYLFPDSSTSYLFQSPRSLLSRVLVHIPSAHSSSPLFASPPSSFS